MAFCHLKLGDPAAADAVLAPFFPGPFPAPWDYRLPLLRADVLAARGDREAALELLTGLLKRQPEKALERRAALLIRIGMWQQEGGRPAAAISALKKAAALVTDDPTVVSRGQRAVLAASLGRLYYTTGAYAQSLRWFQDAALLEEHPSTVAELLYWQGAVLARLGRLDEFDRLLATMRKAFPQSHWTTMAANLLQEQRWQEENRQ
jgi:tetratricopeptide (TPR) repeat protein